jgi:phage tail protein X
MRRFVRGLAALIVLAAVLVGVPWLLITMVGNPLPTGSGLHAFGRALTRPDDGTILIKIIAVIAWIAWLVSAISVVVELIAALTRQRLRIRMPGLGGPQKIAGALVLLVLAMFAAPHHAVADPAPDQPSRHTSVSAPTTTTSTTSPSTTSPRTPGAEGAAHEASGDHHGHDQAGDSGAVLHIVQPGDDLWTLAEHYYGKGQDWRLIARANPAVLTGGPDRLQPGWRLRIPGVDPHQHRVVVRPGDTLSAIAQREYGDPTAWHRIYHANRGVVSDPDLLPVGLALTVPTDRSGPDRADHADHPDHASGHDDRTDRSARARHTEQADRTGGIGRGGESAGEPPGDGRRTQQDAGRSDASEPADPASGAPRTEQQPAGAPTADDGAVQDVSGDASGHALQIAGITGLMAAAVIGGLATRRQLQLRTREVGRRIPQSPPAAQQLEAELGRRQTPAGMELLDAALRSIGAECHRQNRPLPQLQAVRCGDDGLVLIMSEPGQAAPVGFLVDGREWRLAPADAEFVLGGGGGMDAPQPYPALASLGAAPDGSIVLVNLEAAGLFAVTGRGAEETRGVLTAAATELAFTPWADELVITLVGDDHGLAASIDRYNVSAVTDLDHLLDRWEHRAGVQRDHLSTDPGRGAGDYRIDPDLADPWVPEVGLIFTEPDRRQAERLERLLLSEPSITTAAVVIGRAIDCPWRETIDPPTGTAELVPLGWPLTPQMITEPLDGMLADLIATTGRQDTEPAPWWAADFGDTAHPPARALSGPPSDEQPDVRAAEHAAGRPRPLRPAVAAIAPVGPPGADPAGGNTRHATGDTVDVADTRQIAAAGNWPSIAVTPTDEPLEELVARSDAAWAWLTPVDRPRASKESAIVPNPFAAATAQVPRHPTILLLGPAELVGAAGERPNRAIMQCIEYCTWLVEHPGSTAQAMAAALAVAEGTRRSNMSRLRNWLGADDRGEPYLPDAYSGKITLSPLVSSDWHRLQLLTHAGVNRTGTEGLANALDLVRGAPLADAAPGQWHWAEEMRTDMVSVIRDIGIELTDRALSESHIDLARWAASRALTAAPQDEFLIGARIRTEYQAGNAAEVERLALQLAAQGRALGVDLHPDTVDLLQQVMEGRLRARA